MTFALTGAPSGLKVRNLGPGRGYALEGVPASALSAEAAARAPVYLTAKGAGGSTVSFRVPLYFVRNSAYSVAHTCYKSKTTSFGLGDQYKVDWSSFTTVSPAVKGFSWTASSQAVKYKADAVGIKKVKLTRKVKGFPDGSSKRGSYSEFREIAFTALGTTPADVDFKNIPSEELGTVGVSYSRDVSAWFKGDKSPSMSNLPPGLKFNASKKKITGKPSKAGSWGVKIQKVVKNKKQTAYMLFRVSAGAGATIALNKTGAEIRSTGNMVAVLAGYKDTTSFSVSSSKAKVSVSGLPKGFVQEAVERHLQAQLVASDEGRRLCRHRQGDAQRRDDHRAVSLSHRADAPGGNLPRLCGHDARPGYDADQGGAERQGDADDAGGLDQEQQDHGLSVERGRLAARQPERRRMRLQVQAPLGEEEGRRAHGDGRAEVDAGRRPPLC